MARFTKPATDDLTRIFTIMHPKKKGSYGKHISGNLTLVVKSFTGKQRYVHLVTHSKGTKIKCEDVTLTITLNQGDGVELLSMKKVRTEICDFANSSAYQTQ